MREDKPSYTAHDYTASIPVDDYVRRFRDADRFMEYCRQCRNYGRSWACPPFSHDIEREMRQYRHVLLIATKIVPEGRELPLSESHGFILPEKKRIDGLLLEMERKYDGRAFTYTGTCPHCPKGACARLHGEPCRHPELVRPSLEAYGFDVTKTLSRLFGIEAVWGKDGLMPEYLTLVCALFHNSDPTTLQNSEFDNFLITNDLISRQ